MLISFASRCFGGISLLVLATVAALHAKAQSASRGDGLPAAPSRREWMINTLFAAIDNIELHSPEQVAARNEWRRVRREPGVVEDLISIVRDTMVTPLVRANAIMALGGTGQPAGFARLLELLRDAPRSTPLRLNIILGLGSGLEGRPEAAYRVLEDELNNGNASERRAAGYALAFDRSPRAIAALTRRVTSERDAQVRVSLEYALGRAQDPR